MWPEVERKLNFNFIVIMTILGLVTSLIMKGIQHDGHAISFPPINQPLFNVPFRADMLIFGHSRCDEGHYMMLIEFGKYFICSDS